MALWLEVRNPTGFRGALARRNLDDGPCPAIAAEGLWGSYRSQYSILDDGCPPPRMMKQDKPPYRVPLMTEVAAIPWNGLNVVSTFSGCGGSCLGYRMAGYRVLWANEFVPAAQDSYRLNHPGSILDCRDIKTVQPEEILKATGLKAGELDLFDGSPPCQAFSTAGKREKGWGKDKTYEHGAKQKNETLFTEYIRLLRGLKPRAFIAENVSGLVKGTAKGYFLEILAALKASGYRVEAKLLDAQWLGVPQMRQRIIFQGVREDLGKAPVWPKPLPYRYSVRDALPWIVGATVHPHGFTKGDELHPDLPAPSVPASGAATYTGHRVEARLEGGNGFNGHAYKSTDELAGCIQAGRPLRIEMMPPSRKPGAFQVQEVEPDAPCATVTIASPGNDLAVPIPGQTERRKFTIAELRRICAFPDDFELAGSYSQQWERLGNSVPPLMMRAIALPVAEMLKA